jgi:uncharacterized protein
VDTADAGRAFREAVSQDLRRAQKVRDRSLMRTYRSLLSAIDNAEAVDAVQSYDPTNPGLGETEVPRKRLDAATVQAIVEAEINERLDAAAQYRAVGADDAATEFDAQCEVLRRYLEGMSSADADAMGQ